MSNARAAARRAMRARAMTTTGTRNMGRLALDPTSNFAIDGPCGCGGRLGALGTSVLTGTLISKGAGIAAGAAVTSAVGTAVVTSALTAVGAGAAAGSVVPVIGTVVGAVVGYLTSKLFGHANYAAVYANIENVAALFQAYTQVAGQYPGRVYGWPEIQYIFHGAMVSGLFTGNGPPPGVVCTQAMISSKITACGTGQWIDDWLGNSKPGTAGQTNNIANIIATALAAGVTDPVTVAQNYLVPDAEVVAKGKNNGWISVAGSQNPALYRQMLIDVADVLIQSVQPNLPVYYGAIPGDAAATVAPPVATQPTQQVQPVNTQQAPTPAPALSPIDASITAPNGQLVTSAGVWSWNVNASSAQGYAIWLNGQSAGEQYGTQLYIGPNGAATLVQASGVEYVWSGNQWTATGNTSPASAPTTGATAASTAATVATQPTSTPAGTSYSPAGNISASTPGAALTTSYGTLSFKQAPDSTGNYPVQTSTGALIGSQNGIALEWDGVSQIYLQNLAGAVYIYAGGQWALYQNAPAASSTSTNVGTLTQVGTDQSGNPVYQATNGQLYEAPNGVITPYSGAVLPLSAGGYSQQAVQDAQSGYATPTPYYPDTSSDDSSSYPTTYSAPAAAAPLAAVSGSSTGEKVLIVGGVAAVGLVAYLLMHKKGGRHRRAHG
jgi:hypothetical protein